MRVFFIIYGFFFFSSFFVLLVLGFVFLSSLSVVSFLFLFCSEFCFCLGFFLEFGVESIGRFRGVVVRRARCGERFRGWFGFFYFFSRYIV